MNNQNIQSVFNSMKDDKSHVSYYDLWSTLEKNGILKNDIRLEKLRQKIEHLKEKGKSLLNEKDFTHLMEGLDGFDIIKRATSGELVISNFQYFEESLIKIFKEVKKNKSGHVADYIPELADIADKDGFAVSICTKDGQMFSYGDTSRKFGLQSTCKSINYLIALDQLEEEKVHSHIGREPSGRAFNAPEFKRMKISDKEDFSSADGYKRIPHNPLINAGAIMCCALIAAEDDHKRSNSIKMVRKYWEKLVAGSGVSTVLPDPAVEESESDSAYTNTALSNMMLGNGVWPKRGDNTIPQVDDVLTFYFKCCAMEVNADMMAIAAATLANSGKHPFSSENIFKGEHVKNCLSMMYSCGMYDYSGEFAFRVGLPAKSGVSGSLMLIVPDKMGICIWSPRLDENGNTVRGIEFCEKIEEEYNLHVYDGLINKQSDIFNLNTKRLTQKTALINAASTGDIGLIHKLEADGLNLAEDNGDYDSRTPLHLAAAEGHLAVVKLLISRKAKVNPRDRWGSTPLDDAYSTEREDIIQFLESKKGERRNEYRDSVSVIMAASEGNLDILKACHESNIDLGKADYDNRTPLHLAVAENHVDTVRFLLQTAKVEANPKDRWNKTPLDEASANKADKRIIDMLKKYS